MRRLLLTLFLAHVVASYGVLVAVTAVYGPQGPEVWLVAPAWAPVAVWDVTADPFRFDKPWLALAAVDGAYAAAFAAVLGAAAAGRRLARRRPRAARRKATGLCTECGYDLRGNVSGTCPECGVPMSPKARMLKRMLMLPSERH